ncbi:hypothetical protein SK128_008085 [Halocaridina rubra]|uniref:Sodium/glucose cotransporter 4 n=1 Tax=Halocaridina rubra TaxID=373956 RepID=A0AAN8XLU6_HALRR
MTEAEGSRLEWPDIVVIAIYFGVVLTVGIWSSKKSQKTSISGYFLASRNMHWIPVGASVFASNLGSGHFIGLAGAGAASGIAVAGYEQGAVYLLMMLGWWFVPVYLSSGVYTMPQYLQLRFGGRRITLYISCLSLSLAIFTKISADLYAGALFLQLSLNKSSEEWLYLSILILLAVAAIFTIAGGLTAVVYTDLVQTFIMVCGAFVLMGKVFSAVGGFYGLVEKYPYAVASIRAFDASNHSCGEPPEDYMSLLRTLEPGKSNYPWIGMVFGMGILELWYWCMDQVMVQRTLASKNVIHAKSGCILASYLKFLPMWFIVFPGMAARILYPERVACAHPDECRAICGSARGCSNIAYPELVLNLLPVGLRGLILAVMLAALMSSLTSVFNSASTVFTMDVWMELRKKLSSPKFSVKPSDMELIIVGRITVLILVAISIIWIPVIQNIGTSELFDYINTINSFLAPPICAVYLLAIFWVRTTEMGAFWGLMTGLGTGIVRFFLELYYALPPCGSHGIARPPVIEILIGKLHYLHFCCLLCALTGAVTVAVSLMSKPLPESSLYRLTFWSRYDKRVRCQQAGDKEQLFDKDESKANTRNTDVDQMEIQPTKEVTGCWKIMKSLCGVPIGKSRVESTQADHPTKEEEAEAAVELITEPPRWRRVVNINAIICLTLSTFVYGYFA